MKTVAVLTPDPHVNAPEDAIAHFPLDDVSMKPDPLAAAVKVAHVPEVYHVPPLMMQPFVVPPVTTFR